MQPSVTLVTRLWRYSRIRTRSSLLHRYSKSLMTQDQIITIHYHHHRKTKEQNRGQ